MKTIWGNTIVKNEGLFLWFAVMSVIDYLDKLLLWDTGSSDSTIRIIDWLSGKYPQKIKVLKLKSVDAEGFSKLRQKMLEESKGDWIFMLDGDEVWWTEVIKKVREIINKNGDNLNLIVTPFYSIVGDIYHYQEEEAGMYNLMGRRGHLNIRAVNRKIPGLHIARPYGSEGFFDKSDKPIQEGDQKAMLFLDKPYLHLSNVKRSDLKHEDQKVIQRKNKIRHEIGKKFPKDFKYPEVFYMDRPDFIVDPWQRMSAGFKLRSLVETPLRKIKRRVR